MTVFNVIEKQQKSRFCLQFFLLKSSLQTQKSTFTAKFIPSPSFEAILFALIRCWGRATALILVHTGLASIFNIIQWSQIPKHAVVGQKNSSVVESQGYFALERPFLLFHEQRAKFTNEVNHLTRFFEMDS